jgi:hypothetical protein
MRSRVDRESGVAPVTATGSIRLRVGRRRRGPHLRSRGVCGRAGIRAFLEHERAKTELKGLMPEDAKEAFGHGVRAKRSKAGAVSFEAIAAEVGDAPVE